MDFSYRVGVDSENSQSGFLGLQSFSGETFCLYLRGPLLSSELLRLQEILLSSTSRCPSSLLRLTSKVTWRCPAGISAAFSLKTQDTSQHYHNTALQCQSNLTYVPGGSAPGVGMRLGRKNEAGGSAPDPRWGSAPDPGGFVARM